MSVAGIAQTAHQVLDQTASKLKASGGIEAQFEATQFVGVTENGTVGGQICVQGNRFKLTSPSITTWFDGRTQWTLLTGSDEVNVSTPTDAEIQQMNPYTFINLYKKGYNLKLAGTTYHGKACHEVRLVAQNKQSNIQLLIAVIDKKRRCLIPSVSRTIAANGQEYASTASRPIASGPTPRLSSTKNSIPASKSSIFVKPSAGFALRNSTHVLGVFTEQHTDRIITEQ